jgi:alpha-1,2-rhamnosyltransferase
LNWIEKASDEDLAREMQLNEIGIMASHAEGFGLPILEYSNNGLKLVLSDIPVFREVAGDVGHYFDVSSIGSLDDAINSAREENRVFSIPQTSWKDTAHQVLSFLEANIGK